MEILEEYGSLDLCEVHMEDNRTSIKKRLDDIFIEKWVT